MAASTRHISHSGHAHLRCIKCNIVAVIQRRRSRPGKIPGNQQPATPRTSSPPGITYPRPPNPVLHLMQLSPEFEPGHRPPVTSPPAPPRGQPCHEPKPPAAFRVIARRAQLRHSRAAAIGDLHPDNAGAGRDRDRDRLPGKTRAAVPHAVAEKLGHEQGSVIPAGVPRAEHRAHERAGNPRSLPPPGNTHALPNRRPSHQRTCLPVRPGKSAGPRAGAREMHAHLSRQRQAKYASPAGCPQVSDQLRLPLSHAAGEDPGQPGRET